MMEDTLRGGASSTEMVRILCENSGPDLGWLQSTFDLDLSLVARLGGHSQPRTHRGRGRFPGMTITFAVLQMLEKIAEGSDRVRIVSGARVVRLLVEDGQCMGCVYQKDGQECEGHGPVVVATGGFGADFTETSLLAQHRPDLLHLPTTSGRHCTGDGIKLGQSIGAGTVDLEWVQLHPTGLVKPDDPDAKLKYLIDDGVGSLIVNADGRRFVNEFGRRDYIVEQLWKNKPPFRLLLNKAGTAQIPWHCEHYARLGVMKYYPSGEELARDMGVPLSVLEATHESHYQAALQTEDDPDGGPWPAFPSGRSWDEASGKTGAGKRFFHNALPGSKVKEEPFYVAMVTPVIHYCMGGLQIDSEAAVLTSEGLPIPGLFAAGETTGGVHGHNRLGGNSLLDCVVFGRRAGRAAAKVLPGRILDPPVSLAELARNSCAGPADEEKEELLSPPTPLHARDAAFGMEEVSRLRNFLAAHPGGELVIASLAGQDATREFQDKYAPECIVGYVSRLEPLVDHATIREGGLKSLFRGAVAYLLAVVFAVGGVLWAASDLKVAKDSDAINRSAMLLVAFLVMHALGNLYTFLGPADVNSLGYFNQRLALGSPIHLLEAYLLVSLTLHAVLGLKTAWRQRRSYSRGRALKTLNLAVSGALLLVFVAVHLCQFRFGDASEVSPYYIRPPESLVDFSRSPPRFWTDDPSIQPVRVRNLYALQYKIFSDPRWFYVLSTLALVAHLCVGWSSAVTKLGIPRMFVPRAERVGRAVFGLLGMMFISVPLYVVLTALRKEEEAVLWVPRSCPAIPQPSS
ncbi:unnamed protein product [Polarella glacialis]|uniref:Uncharacterized protein n=1 Tax=Polarella glacialis TaxID=89957 RepID=A0A813HES4_POLGL|nr:unnamed protein product [Polarella glacialis]